MTYIGTSQNGWPVYTDRTHFTLISAAGRDWWCANDDVATIFNELINRFDRDVESITRDDTELDDWSYAVRPIRGQNSGYSNHASATAVDINALQHLRGVKNTFTKAQVTAIRAILRDIGVIRWGGDYVNATVDEMHFEINANKTLVHTIAQEIRDSMPTAKEVADAVWNDEVVGDTISTGPRTINPADALRRLKSKVDDNTDTLAELNKKIESILVILSTPKVN